MRKSKVVRTIVYLRIAQASYSLGNFYLDRVRASLSEADKATLKRRLANMK